MPISVPPVPVTAAVVPPLPSSGTQVTTAQDTTGGADKNVTVKMSPSLVVPSVPVDVSQVNIGAASGATISSDKTSATTKQGGPVVNPDSSATTTQAVPVVNPDNSATTTQAGPVVNPDTSATTTQAGPVVNPDTSATTTQAGPVVNPNTSATTTQASSLVIPATTSSPTTTQAASIVMTTPPAKPLSPMDTTSVELEKKLSDDYYSLPPSSWRNPSVQPPPTINITFSNIAPPTYNTASTQGDTLAVTTQISSATVTVPSTAAPIASSAVMPSTSKQGTSSKSTSGATSSEKINWDVFSEIFGEPEKKARKVPEEKKSVKAKTRYTPYKSWPTNVSSAGKQSGVKSVG